MLSSTDLLARLRTGGGMYEPPAVELEWRSRSDEGLVLESGFSPEAGDDASSDAAALCGDDLVKFGGCESPPWRDSYVIRPVTVAASGGGC